MLIEEALNRAVRHYIDAVISSGYAIKADQNAPRPQGPYCSVKTLSMTPTGWDQTNLTNQQSPDIDLDERIEGHRLVMFSLNFYRDSAVDNANFAHIAAQRESIRQLFESAKIGLQSRSQIREISEPVDAGIEERAQFDLGIYTVANDDDVILCIQALDVIGNYDNQSSVYTHKIEVNNI